MEDVIRCTVIDQRSTVSFIAHWAAAASLTAACSHDPTSLDELLAASVPYDRGLRALVQRGLAIFDEHNVPGELHNIHQRLKENPHEAGLVFRVLDETTREESLRPARAGVVLFNLRARRIVQIQNTYDELKPEDTVNYHNGKFLSIRSLPYQLPPSWNIVP